MRHMYHIIYTSTKFSTIPLSARKRVFTSSCHAGKTSKSCKASKPSMTTFDFWSDKTIWQRTRINTLRCLVGCTAGDFSTMWYLQSAHPSMSAITCTAISMVRFRAYVISKLKYLIVESCRLLALQRPLHLKLFCYNAL
ncbi:unnamed protein product [Umbelopsis ramanniana]